MFRNHVASLREEARLAAEDDRMAQVRALAVEKEGIVSKFCGDLPLMSRKCFRLFRTIISQIRNYISVLLCTLSAAVPGVAPPHPPPPVKEFVARVALAGGCAFLKIRWVGQRCVAFSSADSCVRSR